MTKKSIHLLLLAILAEILILTENLAIRIINLFSSNPFMQSTTGNLLTCLFWAVGIALIYILYIKDRSIHFENVEKPKRKQFLIGGMLLLVTLIISLISWGGFKIVKELMFGVENIVIGLGIILDGTITTICALLYGCAFLAMKKNIKYAFPLIFFMFIL